jgi:hypothetical protein
MHREGSLKFGRESKHLEEEKTLGAVSLYIAQLILAVWTVLILPDVGKHHCQVSINMP